MVTRKKTEVVQLSKIRMREELRQKLARDAERKGATLNGEIVGRLEKSYGADERVSQAVTAAAEATENFKKELEKASDERFADLERFFEDRVAKIHKLYESQLAAYQEEAQRQLQENIQREAEKARREGAIVDLLLGRNEASSFLLRAIAVELATKPEWSSSKQGILDMAEAIRLHVYSTDRRFQQLETEALPTAEGPK